MVTIKKLTGNEILDSRGNPTVEVEIHLSEGTSARAAVPSGASTGTLEAVELRDNDPKRFHGKGVQKAIRHLENEIAPALIGQSPFAQLEIDELMIRLDGTENKARFGANAILGASMAVARAAAISKKISLYEHLASLAQNKSALVLPLPMFNIMNGGVHADSSLDFQEFMVAPVGASTFSEAVRMASEVYQSLRGLLHEQAFSIAIGDEGGFAPKLKSNEDAIELIIEAIEMAGYRPGDQIAIALDPAASEFFEQGQYHFRKSDGRKLEPEAMISYWEGWLEKYPILSLEDGLAEQDWQGWRSLTARMGKRLQLVGDDIFVTNPKIIEEAIEKKIGNAALIKLNQIGTVTETIRAVAISRRAHYGTVISHRSGETWDDFISDFAVGAGALQIKAGAPVRGERVAKYNRLMAIERELKGNSTFAGSSAFKRS